jgi:hypothetical protein
VAFLVGGILVCLGLIWSPIAVPSIVRHGQCASAAFYCNHIGPSDQPIPGILAVFCASSALLWSLSLKAGRLRTVAVACAPALLLVGYGVLADNANYLVQADASNLRYRQGFLDTMHAVAWTGVQNVTVSCRIETTRTSGYAIATADLTLQDGVHVPMEFLQEDRDKWLKLTDILKQNDRSFKMDRTAGPNRCPGSLYGDIRTLPAA